MKAIGAFLFAAFALTACFLVATGKKGWGIMFAFAMLFAWLATSGD